MHELGVISNLVDASERLAAQNNIQQLAYIKVNIGEMSGVVSQYVKNLWKIGTKETLLEGAELIVNDIAAIVECEDCGEQFSLMKSADENNDKPCCPKCGSKTFFLVNDDCKELVITELGAVD